MGIVVQPSAYWGLFVVLISFPLLLWQKQAAQHTAITTRATKMASPTAPALTPTRNTFDSSIVSFFWESVTDNSSSFVPAKDNALNYISC